MEEEQRGSVLVFELFELKIVSNPIMKLSETNNHHMIMLSDNQPIAVFPLCSENPE